MGSCRDAGTGLKSEPLLVLLTFFSCEAIGLQSQQTVRYLVRKGTDCPPPRMSPRATGAEFPFVPSQSWVKSQVTSAKSIRPFWL